MLQEDKSKAVILVESLLEEHQAAISDERDGEISVQRGREILVPSQQMLCG